MNLDFTGKGKKCKEKNQVHVSINQLRETVFSVFQEYGGGAAPNMRKHPLAINAGWVLTPFVGTGLR